MRDFSRSKNPTEIKTEIKTKIKAEIKADRSSEQEQTKREQILLWLEKNVPKARIQHILRVEQFSRELALHHSLDAEQAAQAGLLHDLAKFFKPDRLLGIAQAEGLNLDPVDVANPHLLHAEASAIVAREKFGIQDPEILEAIANHTLGKPEMSLLSCVVFLADSLEPGRGHSSELQVLREASYQDLYRAVYLTCDFSLQELIKNCRLIHPRTILTRNWAVQTVSSNSKLKF